MKEATITTTSTLTRENTTKTPVQLSTIIRIKKNKKTNQMFKKLN